MLYMGACCGTPAGMPRCARVTIGGMVYHVLNRSNARLPLLECDADYGGKESGTFFWDKKGGRLPGCAISESG